MGIWTDITLPITADAVAWSGVAAPRLALLGDMQAGATVNVGQLDCCLHTGTHADAPWHVDLGGATIDRMDPGLYLGPARVIATADPHCISQPELAERLKGLQRQDPTLERLLIATPQPYDGRHFPKRIPALDPEAAEWLLWLGVRLIGVNVPSVDPLDSKTMDSHRLLFAAGAGLLENLDLRGVGVDQGYWLSAPPIKVLGADAAPVRALLRRL
ncbi:MAG: cyclase family protein [Anaerolineae bacterium]